jgi:hypothetical protein
MQERIDRRIGSDRLLFWLLALLFAAIAAGSIIYTVMRPAAPPAPSPQETPAEQPAATPQAGADEPLGITLYYPADGALVAGTIPVKRQADAQTQARETLAASLGDPRVVQNEIFREFQLRGFYLDASGTAYVDLATGQQVGVKASAWDELLAIYAVVDTLSRNFEEIKRVRFLIEGKEAQTLAGHIDLSRPFEARMDLVKQQVQF